MISETLRKAVEKYGIQNQTMVLCEECGELIQASSKAVRYGDVKSINNLIEEMADVWVMVDQLCYFYGIEWKDVVDVYMEKVERLKKRMEE